MTVIIPGLQRESQTLKVRLLPGTAHPCELYGAKCAIHIAKSSNGSQNVY